MEVTLQDIANELDLSTATVSRSLRHDRLIHPETRARVNEAARRLGYKSRARKLRRPAEGGEGSRALGLSLCHSSLDAAQHDGNLMKMMAGIMSVADEHGMHLKVHPRQPQGLEQSLRQSGEEPAQPGLLTPEGGCQALIAHGEQDESDLAFFAHRMPVVSMGRSYRDLPIDSAVADNIEGVHRLVTHLVELGHRRLAWVGASYTATFVEERKAGFVKGCLTHNLEFGRHSFFGPEIYRGQDIHAGNALLEALGHGVTGFVCGNDGVALQVIRLLEGAGRRVPHDASVTGFDASSQSNTRHPTSVDPHFFEIGQAAARLALQRLSHPLAHSCTMSVRGNVVLGDTTAPAPGASATQTR